MKKEYMHFIITRFNIPTKYAGRKNTSMDNVDPKTNEKYLDYRMNLFDRYTFPSLKNQTNKNFKWLVLFSNQTPQKYKKRLQLFAEEFTNFCPLYLTDEEAYNFDIYLESVLNQYDCDTYITTRIDNDDAISINMIEEIQKYYKQECNENLLLSFTCGLQYTEKTKRFATQNIKGNHFITMILTNPSKTVISFPHNKIPKEITTVTMGEKKKPMWIEVIHENNYANQTFFNIKNAVKSSKIIDDFMCDISWNQLDVIKNIIISIPDTFKCIYQLIKK